ncbi:MAG: heparinase II/III family protein [Gemmatimonadota bacterium]
MVTGEALLERLTERAQPVLAKMPAIPRIKALLSSDGGVCPEDGSTLVFDPWSPHQHRCARCNGVYSGERHDGAWAKYQHLWLSERAAHLATVAALGSNEAAAERAAAILRSYDPPYFELPNRDNVLGPSHLFFSTYLESIWVLNIIAAATQLRTTNLMDEELIGSIDRIADEAASLIGEFNEGFSNRQTWHAAALTAIAAWFEDDDLARQAIEGRTGLLGHLADGFGEDGTWFEGENYHLFALRGLLVGLGWARSMGAELLEDEAVASHLRAALMAPARTALPDLTFPARKDSRYGVSLAQPMYLELWEVGRSLAGDPDGVIGGWLNALYQVPAQPALTFDSYLHEAAEPPPSQRTRADLSWWTLLHTPDEQPEATEWKPASVYLPSPGLAILRNGSRYASLECGATGGGHGHPDRLHLTLHADGVHWLPDFGTGSYVARDLFWYRSTLSHNAPLVDGKSQPLESAVAQHFDQKGDWGWMHGTFEGCDRTVVAGPSYLLDILTFSAADPHQVELAWHLAGEIRIETPGSWEPVAFENEFVTNSERFVPSQPGVIVVRGAMGARQCRLHLLFEGDLLRMRAPGTPGSGPADFLLCRAEGALARMTTVVDLSPDGRVTRLVREGERITVTHEGSDQHVSLLDGWQVETGGSIVKLGGAIRAAATTAPMIVFDRPDVLTAPAAWVSEPPALDGTPDGFDQSYPLTLDTELQYRRSEEPYPGPESLSATAFLNWNDEAIFLMVEVVKPELAIRPGNAPPLTLDNEVDDIHSDGLQVYLARAGRVLGFLVVPEANGQGLRVRTAGETEGIPGMIEGSWSRTDEGYRVTLVLRPDWYLDDPEGLKFDLLINEMYADRQRRAGQLVWSGGNGWVYLQGDRQDPRRFGVLELVP